MNTHEKLKKIIREASNRDIDIENINADTILTDDLGFDSIQIISLIVEIECEFMIEIEDEDLDIEKLTIYKSLYDVIVNKLEINND